MTIQGCGLIETPYNFFIDHLAPLCAFLNIPIISSHAQTKFLYQRTYPDVEIRLKAWDLSYLFKHYSTILYSFVPYPPFQTLVNDLRSQYPENPLWKKQVKFVYHFHGCSDKGYHSTWIQNQGHLQDLDLLILYGKRIADILSHKNLLKEPKKTLFLGNYRKTYYEKHQTFFDQKVQNEILSQFTKDLPILLYAPTWQDHESSCSFYDYVQLLTQSLSHEFNVLIKLHPNMTSNPASATKTNELIEKISTLANTVVLPFYPLVYPILNQIDAYIGDYSSIGYDLLSFQKPMFFLNANARPLNDPGSLLLKCGTVISTKNIDKLPQLVKASLKNHSPLFRSIQRKTNLYAFGPPLSEIEIKKRLVASLSE